MKNIVITVDGTAASGKEKISKFISRKWKLKHLDSGLLYRRLAYILLRDNVDFKSISAIKKTINNISSFTYRKSKKDQYRTRWSISS